MNRAMLERQLAEGVIERHVYDQCIAKLEGYVVETETQIEESAGVEDTSDSESPAGSGEPEFD